MMLTRLEKVTRVSIPPSPPNTLPDENVSLIPFHDDGLPLDPTSYRSQNAPPARQSGTGCRSCLTLIGGGLGCLSIVIIAVIALAILLPTAAVSSLLSSIASALGADMPVSAGITSPQSIVTGIQPLGQLVSVSVQLAQADIQVSISQGFVGSCGYTANHVTQGAIEAGIDMTQITTDDLTYDEARNTYVLTVPAPELTSCRVDYIRQYEVTGTLCAVDADEARLLANYVSLTSFRNTALEGGILTRAENETRAVLSNFVRAVTGSNVEIVFEQPAQATAEATPEPFTSSCAPDMPPGWYQNERGEWLKR
jgi:hypothetical protein